jgi:hypothetical protein
MIKKNFLKKASAIILGLATMGILGSQVFAAVPGSGWWALSSYQNIGTSNANISITAYQTGTTNTYTHTPGVLATGASYQLSPSGFAGLPAGFVGSFTASSDQPLAAVVNLTNKLSGGLGVSGGKAAAIYSGVNNPATTLLFPSVKHNHFGKTSTIYLQNAGNSATTISVTISVSGVSYPYTSPTIQPGFMLVFDAGLAGVPSGNGNVGSATVTSANPVAGTQVEHEHSASIATIAQAYDSFSTSQLSNTSYCPSFKKNYFGRSGAVQVQNAHTTTQDITVKYYNTSGYVTSDVTTNVASGASIVVFKPASIIDGLYSVIVEGSAGNVAAIVNESELPLVSARQTSVTYNCVNNSITTNKVVYPAYRNFYEDLTTAIQVQNIGTSNATNVVLTFVANNGTTYTTTAQTINAGASKTFVNMHSFVGWTGSALPQNTISGLTITSDQPIVAIVNESSWLVSGGPNNDANTNIDKAGGTAINQ